jgi:hypothetical protein
MHLFWAAILFVNLFHPFALAEDFSVAFQKYSNAVVKIYVRQMSYEVSVGSGFFVSADGKIITNSHVINPALTPGFGASVYLKDGSHFDKVDFIGCAPNGLDLCYLKVNAAPTAWIDLTKVSTSSEGSPVIAIGHPKGLSWTISDGLISSKRSWPLKDGLYAQMIQISNPISPGNSGGPVLNSRGELVGVVTAGMFANDSQNLNFAISADEVRRFTKSLALKAPVDLGVVRKNIMETEKALSKKFYETYLKPMTNQLLKGAVPTDSTVVEYAGPVYKYRFRVPKAVVCNNMKDGMLCKMPGGDAVVVEERKAIPDFMSMNGKTPSPEPLDYVKNLMSQGKFDLEKIPKKQRKFFFSQPDKIKCQVAKAKITGTYKICSNFIDLRIINPIYGAKKLIGA